MKGGLGALPTGLGALKIRVTSRPNGQCLKSNEFPTLYLIMYFQQFKWFLINLLLTICILRYALLLDVLIDICFVLLCI